MIAIKAIIDFCRGDFARYTPNKPIKKLIQQTCI
jgi:hypothetical protein